MADAPERAYIFVDTKMPRFTLFEFPYRRGTTVTMDGIPHHLEWGETVFPVRPGRHELRVEYIFGALPSRPSTTMVDVPPGETVRITYRALGSPYFGLGKFKVEPQ